jgi:L-rhamnose isomerase
VSQSGENVEGSEDTLTKNELVVKVTARLGVNGTPVELPSVTIPAGTARDTRFLLGGESDLYDRIDDVQVVPGSSLRLMDDGSINWSVYDLITIETVP